MNRKCEVTYRTEYVVQARNAPGDWYDAFAEDVSEEGARITYRAARTKYSTDPFRIVKRTIRVSTTILDNEETTA